MAQETNLKAQKLLVFGVTGLIGSRILKALIAAGSSFECISAFVSPGSLEKKRDLIESLKSRGIKVIIGDVNSDDDVRAAYQGVLQNPINLCL